MSYVTFLVEIRYVYWTHSSVYTADQSLSKASNKYTKTAHKSNSCKFRIDILTYINSRIFVHSW